MKRLILIKQSSAIQLGHLYEHIFCAHIDTFLYEHHLFSHLDYSLTGKTYYGGIVAIDIELYTDAAIKLSNRLSSLAIELNEEIISIAATQILAEKEEPVGGTGYDNVKQALEELHKQPWQNIDEVECIDTKSIRKKTGPFYIAEGKPLPARKLTASILLDDKLAASHRELLPLFRQFAWLMTSSFQGVLADTYGYFSHEDVYKDRSPVGVINTFKVANDNASEVDLSDILATCLEVVRDLQQYGAFTRYMDELCKASYYNHSGLAPNLEKNYEDTFIFIGPKGWRKIATDENYRLLLKHMSIEVKFGRDKISQPL
ncbi:MAG TPA: hypothetical protein VFH06_02305 [Candidatus Saccharimonadales bacterium]|nr:hypothetical protein [Candidatus Saccharimonadales bacterium]